jgi:hypothetical protein
VEPGRDEVEDTGDESRCDAYGEPGERPVAKARQGDREGAVARLPVSIGAPSTSAVRRRRRSR